MTLEEEIIKAFAKRRRKVVGIKVQDNASKYVIYVN